MTEGNSIPILRLTNDSVAIDTTALNSVLDRVGDRPFACFSIAGPKRTGKSFILNKCLHFLNEKKRSWLYFGWFGNSSSQKNYFEWKGGSERNTRGINIWSKPFITWHNGREIAILLMDTQGSFDDQTTSTQNSIIFALSALMSSILIYNIPRDIGQDTLEFLQLFTGYAKLAIDDFDQGDQENAFQKLIFLIRDFQFSDFKCGYYDEKTCPPGQSKNFRHRLNPKASQPKEVADLRQKILSSFQSVGVFALPHPGTGLAIKDEESNLDGDFAKHAKEFVEFLFSDENIEVKKVGSVEVTGSDFKQYVTVWAQLFQSNSLPEMKSISQAAAEIQSKILIQKFITKYEEGMKKTIDSNPQGIPEHQFKKLHSALKKENVRAFKKTKKLGGKSFEEIFFKELKEEIAARKKIYQDINNTNWRATEQHNKLEDEIKENKKKLAKFQKESKREKEEWTEKYEQCQSKADRLADQLKAIKRDKRRQEREMERLNEKIERQKRKADKPKPPREKSPESRRQDPPWSLQTMLDLVCPEYLEPRGLWPEQHRIGFLLPTQLSAPDFPRIPGSILLDRVRRHLPF